MEVGSRHGKKKQPALSQTTFLANALKDYQFVFQPAMLYMEKPLERKEEGVAIFSHYPIISSSYRLLSRLALPLLCQDVMTMLSLCVCVCVCVQK